MCQADADSTRIGELSSVPQSLVCSSSTSKVETARREVTGCWRKDCVWGLDWQLDCQVLDVVQVVVGVAVAVVLGHGGHGVEGRVQVVAWGMGQDGHMIGMGLGVAQNGRVVVWVTHVRLFPFCFAAHVSTPQ